jgi:cytosine permease
MIIGFLLVLVWMMFIVLTGGGGSFSDGLLFESQLDAGTLVNMGIRSSTDKFIFALNLLVGPACALALNTADFGRFGKSIIGGIIMKSAAPSMAAYFADMAGVPAEAARQQVLKSPDSIAATFMVFGGAIGFLLMILAQAKAQVLNNYSSSLCLANLFDALFRWRPGRLTFVILANVIALALLYGEILHFVEGWIKLMGVLLSALAATWPPPSFRITTLSDDGSGPRSMNPTRSTGRESSRSSSLFFALIGCWDLINPLKFSPR